MSDAFDSPEPLQSKQYFLIRPVRGVGDVAARSIEHYVRGIYAQEAHSFVYDPAKHTDQTDPVGLRICKDNERAIRKAHEILLYFDPTSMGSVFDVGMAFFHRRPLFVLNPDAVLPEPDERAPDTDSPDLADYRRFLVRYARNMRDDIPSDLFDSASAFQREMGHREKPYEIAYSGLSRKLLLDVGMAFTAGRSIYLANPEAVRAEATPGVKSFQNVLLALDEAYRDPSKHTRTTIWRIP